MPWTSARADARVPGADGDTTLSRSRPGGGPSPTDTEDAADPLPGSLIDGRYRVERLLGAGGMSRVYLGTFVMTGVRVAIKIVDPRLSRDQGIQQRILGEARAMMELQSYHIVRAMDVGSLSSGQLYIVMEHLDGVDLEVLLAQGPLSWSRVAAIGVQILSGLATAHRHGIIHRDIKPHNCIRVTLDDNPEHIKIIDFGVARETEIDVGPTQQGFLLGTPEYMAPELFHRGTKADARSDVYSLGVTLYKLLTGDVPFRGATPVETLQQHVKKPLVPPSQAAPGRGIPREADAFLARALAKDPAERFGSAEEAGRELRRTLGGGGSGLTVIPGERVSAQPSVPRASEAQPSRPLDPPPGGTPRPVDTRALLLRMTSLISLGVCFAVGTRLISPRDAPDGSLRDVDAPLTAPAPPTRDTVPALPITPAPAVDAIPSPPIATPEAEPMAAPPPDAQLPPTSDPTPPIVKETPPPVAEDPPPGDPVQLETTPPATPEPKDPAGDATPQIEPDFDYKSAKQLVEEQLQYLRATCLTKATAKAARLKFRADVHPRGRAIIRVFSPDRAVRACVRELFVFPFDPSPRGGAFEYTLTAASGTFQRIPPDPEALKGRP